MSSSYTKTLSFERDGQTYYFEFEIVKEEQNRRFDDGVRFSGVGYSIYILSSPDLYECSRDSNYHFYNSGNTPSICWNSNIHTFRDANAVMYLWAKRYVDLHHQGRERRNYKIGVPDGTFRQN
jgi:hypothetical protein